MKNKNFANSSATCEFLRNFDNGFDLLNSKSFFKHDGKIPLSADNEDAWMEDVGKIQIYILQLRHKKPSPQEDGVPSVAKEPKPDNHLVIDGPRKRGFLGFLISLQSSQLVFET